MNKIIKAIVNPKLALKVAGQKFHKHREISLAKSDSKNISNDESVLFVDLGANMGQGYSWFKTYFNQSNVTFELFEPNPFCYEELRQLPDVISGAVTVHNVGAGAIAGSYKFYGLSENEGGKFSQGGSFVKEHNSIWYKHKDDTAIDIDVINFTEYLSGKAKLFDNIIVKMDIEGAEVELLEGLISNNGIEDIDILYVEFHSQFQEISQSARTKKRESAILDSLIKIPNLKVRNWH